MLGLADAVETAVVVAVVWLRPGNPYGRAVQEHIWRIHLLVDVGHGHQQSLFPPVPASTAIKKRKFITKYSHFTVLI